jgi:hypothetical protein
MNEALEGYAALESTVRITNVVVSPGPANAPTERIDGQPCRREQAQLWASDGSVQRVEVWRAQELKNTPLRLSVEASAATVVLTLSKVRLEAPAAALFAPPPEFTKYSSADAMLTELMTRQAHVKTKKSGFMGDDPDIPDQLRGPGYRGPVSP